MPDRDTYQQECQTHPCYFSYTFRSVQHSCTTLQEFISTQNIQYTVIYGIQIGKEKNSEIILLEVVTVHHSAPSKPSNALQSILKDIKYWFQVDLWLFLFTPKTYGEELEPESRLCVSVPCSSIDHHGNISFIIIIALLFITIISCINWTKNKSRLKNENQFQLLQQLSQNKTQHNKLNKLIWKDKPQGLVWTHQGWWRRTAMFEPSVTHSAKVLENYSFWRSERDLESFWRLSG